MADVNCAAEALTSGAGEISAWVPAFSALAAGLLAGSVALFMSWRSRRHAQVRKAMRKRASGRRRREFPAEARHFVATELFFLLEYFAEECAGLAAAGCPRPPETPDRVTAAPEADFSTVTGEWQCLPVKLLCKVRELDALRNEYARAAGEEGGEARQYRLIRLGLKAVILARRLHRLAGFPEPPPGAPDWAAQRILWSAWRQARRTLHARPVAISRELKGAENQPDVTQPGEKT